MRVSRREFLAHMVPKTDVVPTVVIEGVQPEIDGGRYPIKRIVGDTLHVWADIFREGHGKVAAVLRYRKRWSEDEDWSEVPMAYVDDDRWHGSFFLAENTRYLYTILAYPDVWATWCDETRRKVEAGERVSSEVLEGLQLLREMADRIGGTDGALLRRVVSEVASIPDSARQAQHLFADDVAVVMRRHADRRDATTYDRELEVVVDRPAARFAAWYEMFPRSQGKVPGRSATFKDCEERLPEIRAMGFDVVYLTPIHPIGRTNRKGRNNSVVAGPDDPGSPYAIGNEHGGHMAVDPDLGTIEDFERFVATAKRLGLEVALDFAIQCSPDHPYVRDHPDWFAHRPDGTIKYAENPPKKYQDIYPIDFTSPAWPEIWQEMRNVLAFWIERGVRTFRVDNPHTKPFRFWDWLITSIQHEHPDVIFLSEAFTRPKVMKRLAKGGFSQSYTYFTWRNFKEEIISYLTELTQTEMREYFRGNFFTNTPDILPTILQEGGRPAFKMRLVLAATLSPLYGIYNGYELCENAAVPGKEEYLNSEKYEYKVWDWNRAGNIKEFITRINAIRKENPALQELDNLRFYRADDDNILFYGKVTPDRSNIVLVAVNLDPFQAHETTLHLPLDEIGVRPGERYQVRDCLTDARYLWKGSTQRIRLDPRLEPAAILVVRPWPSTDYESVSY